MDIKKTHPLTNEQTLKKFKSQFDFVSYAIKLAENLIKSGRNPRVRMQTQNPALLVIGEIEEGKDHIDEIIVVAPVSEYREEMKPRAPSYSGLNGMEKEAQMMKKAADKKKPRKLMAR